MKHNGDADGVRHITAKTLRSGKVAYYWTAPPIWRALPGCPSSKALGTDQARAAHIAADLNAHFDRQWRGHRGLL
jgi:hypothetical protein